jgi:hypothetical protein
MFEDSQFDIFIFWCSEKLGSQVKNLDYLSPIARYQENIDTQKVILSKFV